MNKILSHVIVTGVLGSVIGFGGARLILLGDITIGILVLVAWFLAIILNETRN